MELDNLVNNQLHLLAISEPAPLFCYAGLSARSFMVKPVILSFIISFLDLF